MMLLMSVVDMNAWFFFVYYKVVDLSTARTIYDSWLIMSAAAACGPGALLLLLFICGGNLLAYPRYMLILQLVVHTIVLTCLFVLYRGTEGLYY